MYGQKRVCVCFRPARKSSLRTIQFFGDKLVALDSKNDVSIFSLDTRQMVASYAPPGHPTALLTDPTLDYCLIGLASGRSRSPRKRRKPKKLTQDHQVMW